MRGQAAAEKEGRGRPNTQATIASKVGSCSAGLSMS